MKEGIRRSFLKTLSWRALATGLTITLVFAFTGEPLLSVQVGVLEVILKMIFYFLHERLWSYSQWGYETEPNYEQ